MGTNKTLPEILMNRSGLEMKIMELIEEFQKENGVLIYDIDSCVVTKADSKNKRNVLSVVVKIEI